VLSDAQRAALENASVVYVDECFSALESAKPGELLTDTAIDLHLPEGMHTTTARASVDAGPSPS
jgi:hypothetical protein